jgi:GH24 family phage-related lysozyme (muramidase)
VVDLPRLREILEREEGVKYEVYLDHLGYPTCGVGHLIISGDDERGCEVGTPVSEERVAALFKADLKIVEDDCRELFDYFEHLPENIQLVCAAMAFQLGRSRLSGFKKFRAAIGGGLWSDAANEMIDSKWYRQTTARAERMIALVREVEKESKDEG